MPRSGATPGVVSVSPVADPPLVSIVIPTWNRPELVALTIASALGQTYPHIEVILCDDAGDVDLEPLVRDFRDQRLILLRAEVRTWKAGVFLQGLRRASGTYIMELDDDDLLAPDCVAELLAPLERDPTLVASFSDFWVIDDDGLVDEAASVAASRTWTRDLVSPGRHQPFVHVALSRQAFWASICGLLRRSAIDLDDFPSDLESHTDYWLSYLSCREGGAAWYNPDRLGFYREHRGNLTGTVTHRRLVARQDMYRRILGDPRVAEVHDELRRRLAEAMTSEAALFLREGHRREARVRARQTVERSGRTRRLAAIELLSYLPLGPAAARRVRRPWKYRSAAKT